MMKNVIVLIGLILLVAFTARANAGMKSVIGELVNEGDQVTLYTNDGVFALKQLGMFKIVFTVNTMCAQVSK